MKLLLFLFLTISLPMTNRQSFSDWFTGHTMRVDYMLAGDKDSFDIFLYNVMDEPYWGGSEKNRVDTLKEGDFFFEVRDSVTRKLLYSRGFNTLFREWQTTAEASRVKKAFKESLVFPYPGKTVILEIYRHPSLDEKELKFTTFINPSDILIEKRKPEDTGTEDILVSGDSKNKVDIVYIAEGYTASEKDKFLKDVKNFNRYMFTVTPYKESRDKFNVRAVFSISPESGPDNPGNDKWKNTAVNSNFFTFYSERYLTTLDFWKVRDIASAVPYDQIVILVNSNKYGGGGIYNHFCLMSAGNALSEKVFIHEFGHSFAGLGDEYYTSSVAYNGYYDLSKEPVDPNLTTLVQFDRKWKEMVNPQTPVPTPADSEYSGTVGAFEGGGYIAEGIYRPQQECRMKSNSAEGFCKVCQKVIHDMILFYSE